MNTQRILIAAVMLAPFLLAGCMSLEAQVSNFSDFPESFVGKGVRELTSFANRVEANRVRPASD